MAVNIPRGQSDDVIGQIVSVLRRYEADHPRAQIDAYRQNPVSVRVRIIDPELSGRSKPQRSQQVWNYLNELPDDVQGDISTVLLLAPHETVRSFANFEFDDPSPSRL